MGYDTRNERVEESLANTNASSGVAQGKRGGGRRKGVWGGKRTATRETRRGGEYATSYTDGVLQNRTRETCIILFTDVVPTNSIQLIKSEKEKGKKSKRNAQTRPREPPQPPCLASEGRPTHRRGRSGLLWPGLRTAPSPAPRWGSPVT